MRFVSMCSVGAYILHTFPLNRKLWQCFCHIVVCGEYYSHLFSGVIQTPFSDFGKRECQSRYRQYLSS